MVEKIAVKEAGKFAFPNLRVAESKGVRSAGINFQRNRLPGNVHIALFESRMDLDRAVEVPLRQSVPRKIDPKQRRDWNL